VDVLADAIVNLAYTEQEIQRTLPLPDPVPVEFLLKERR
jgi:hypothetical protein